MIIYVFVIFVKINNKYIRWIIEILSKICEPALSIVRRIISTTIMNFDFSPLIIIFILEIIKIIIYY